MRLCFLLLIAQKVRTDNGQHGQHLRPLWRVESALEQSSSEIGAPLISKPVAENARSHLAHGTTTVAFAFAGGIVCCVDSRASMGSFVGSSETEKVLPLSPYIVATMAGSAADCGYFIRYVSARAKLFELEEGRPLSVLSASRMLASALRRQPRGLGLSVGTMIMGFDSQESQATLCYVDSDGARVNGRLFAVGSGSPWAYSVLDAEYRYDLSIEDALNLAQRAVHAATMRDAYSGGYINVFLLNHSGWTRMRRLRSDDPYLARPPPVLRSKPENIRDTSIVAACSERYFSQ